jgi:hypothetical protein
MWKLFTSPKVIKLISFSRTKFLGTFPIFSLQIGQNLVKNIKFNIYAFRIHALLKLVSLHLSFHIDVFNKRLITTYLRI